MELDQVKLKEKALLLLQRERELFELRIKLDRKTAWLTLAQALPQIFADPNLTMAGAFARLRKALLEGLKVQRVSFLAIEPEGLRPIAPAGPVRPLTAEMRALLLGEAVGVVNDQRGPDGAWLGYLQDYPDYWTQGKTLEDLREHLKHLYGDLTSGQIPSIRKVEELVIP